MHLPRRTACADPSSFAFGLLGPEITVVYEDQHTGRERDCPTMRMRPGAAQPFSEARKFRVVLDNCPSDEDITSTHLDGVTNF